MCSLGEYDNSGHTKYCLGGSNGVSHGCGHCLAVAAGGKRKEIDLNRPGLTYLDKVEIHHRDFSL